jgi:hypothetical protein
MHFPMNRLLAAMLMLATMAAQAEDCRAAGFNWGQSGAAAAEPTAATPEYVKISHSGTELPASAALGRSAADWACTQDKTTGLVWEVKVDDAAHLRHMGHTYTWYNADPAANGGHTGTASGGACLATGRCDTEKYVADVNAAGLCGKSDWRMPTVDELKRIANTEHGKPAIDTAMFPNTPAAYFWTGTRHSHIVRDAMFVDFHSGGAKPGDRNYDFPVRLVRGGR